MKNTTRFLLGLTAFACIAMLGNTTEFSIQVANDQLSVASADGKKVASFEQGTVGKEVKVGISQFLLSFGRDVKGNLSAILSPVTNVNSPLEFKTIDQSVKTDGKAIVTIRFSSDLNSSTIDEGFIGRVKVASLKTPSVPSPEKKSSPTQVTKVEDLVKSEPKMESVSSAVEVKNDKIKVASNEEGKSKNVIDLLKDKGIMGLFSGEDAAYSFRNKPSERRERAVYSKRNNPLSSDSIAKSDQSKEIKGNEVLPPEIVAKTSQDKPNDVRLFLVKGNVKVNSAIAKEGELIPEGGVVKTGANSTAVAIIGGLHILSVHPNTEFSSKQTLEGKKMKTVVSLKSGNVFADVNHRKGLKQDFQVKTSAGSVSATGSQALIGFIDGKLVIAAFKSPWKGSDVNNGNSFTTFPLTSTGKDRTVAVAYSSVPEMSGADLQDLVNQIMSQIGVNFSSSVETKFVSNAVASFIQGNASTLPDGTSNPGNSIEGKVRKDLLALFNDFSPEDKDEQLPFSIEDFDDVGGGDLLGPEPFGRTQTLVFTPPDTTPIPR